jgi:hypothetical protein
VSTKTSKGLHKRQKCVREGEGRSVRETHTHTHIHLTDPVSVITTAEHETSQCQSDNT